MKRRLPSWFAALFGLFALAAAGFWLGGVHSASAQAPSGPGIIIGQAVVAGPASNASLSNLPASLFTFINGVRQVPPVASQTDAQGRVRFEGLSTGAGYTYTMYIKFQETIYQSNVIAFAPGATQAAVNVTVRAGATDSGGLRIGQHHLIIDLDPAGRALSVIEFYVITNTGVLTVAGTADLNAGGKPVSFRAPLPPGAVVDSVENRQLGVDVFQAANSLLSASPLPPGESTLIFSYQLTIDHATQTLAIGAPLTTTALNVLVAPRIALRSTRLLSEGPVAAGSRNFQLYSARDLAAGSSIAVELSGLPAPLIPLDVLKWAPLAAASVALAGTLFFVLRRKNDNAPPSRQASA